MTNEKKSSKAIQAHDPIMEEDSTQTILLTSLSTLTPSKLSDLTNSISTLFHHHHRRRITAVLSSPILFSLTLHHLHSLSLADKTLLVARHLKSSLSFLTHYLQPLPATTTAATVPPPASTTKLRDLDSVLILLLLCELRHYHPDALETSPSQWRFLLSKYVSDTLLTLSSISTSNAAVLIQYIDTIAKCRRFVRAMGGGGGKDGREVAASVAAVVALPSTVISGPHEGGECVICKEEMREGRDVCRLPCHHLFHWICVLPWLKKRNTCPCCRHRLPTDDVYGEIGRLWEVVVKVSGSFY